MACRQIPLDKKPGLRPIGVGEVLRRIAGKVVMFVVKNDVTSTAGALQVCAGQDAGAAIHGMHDIYDKEESEAVLLTPLLHFLRDFVINNEYSSKEVAFADNFTVVGKTSEIKEYWEILRSLGPK